jgi:hypothetical protein
MPWPFTIYRLLRPEEKYIWLQVRVLHETDKAILVSANTKFWIPKSRICGIRLKNNKFEVLVKESILG